MSEPVTKLVSKNILDMRGRFMQFLRQKKNMSLLERQQWKKQIMEMDPALQQYVMPEGVFKKHLRAGNVMT